MGYSKRACVMSAGAAFHPPPAGVPISKEQLKTPSVGKYEPVSMEQVFKPLRLVPASGAQVGFDGGSRRFGSSKTGVPGPGTYVGPPEGSMLKKTYNALYARA